MSKIRTCLWFPDRHVEAVRFYTDLIPGSAIEGAIDLGHPPIVINFHLAGTPYQALNGGPRYAPTPAASIQVMTEDQVETDRIWAALVADGGQEGRCAWCVDRFGVSWQVVPRQLPKTVGGPDRDGARRATEAMMNMSKIDIAALEAAYRGAV